MRPATRWRATCAVRVGLALMLAWWLSACGTPYECCNAGLSHGAVGEIGTCYRNGIDEYGTLEGHERCTDDPAGRACVVWLYGRLGPNVRCFDPGGPSYDVPCCTDLGPDGIGAQSTCRCDVHGCAWSHDLTVVPLEGGACWVQDHRPCAVDASCPDAG